MNLRAQAASFYATVPRQFDVQAPGIKMLRDWAAAEPESLDPWLALAEAWCNAPVAAVDGSSEFREVVKRCLDLDPTSVMGWYLQGMRCQHEKDNSAAGSCYEKVLELDPQHGGAQLRLWILSRDFKRSLTPRPAREFDFRDEGDIGLIDQDDWFVLRNAVPRDTLEEIAAEVHPSLLSHWAGNPDDSFLFSDAPRPIFEKMAYLVNRHIIKVVHPRISRLRRRGWQPVNSSRWHFQLHGPSQGRPVPLHSDHPVAGLRNDWTTFIIPLTPCGPGVAPSLRALTAPVRVPLALQRLDRINLVDPAQAEEFFEGQMVPVTLMPGDLLVLGRYALHATYTEAGLQRDRISCDVRLQCGPPIFPDDCAPPSASVSQ